MNDVQGNIIKIINNIQLYKEAKHLCQQLKLTAVACDRLQSGHARCADVTYECLRVIHNKNLKPYATLIESGFNDCVWPQLTCYTLHWRYMGMNLNAELEAAHQWILKDIKPNFLPLITQFQAYESPYPKWLCLEVMRMSVKPAIKWFSLKKEYLALKFVTFNDSSASICSSI